MILYVYNFDDGQTTYVAHEWRVLNFGQACTRGCGQMVRNIDMVTNCRLNGSVSRL